jgi:hypothetical protein
MKPFEKIQVTQSLLLSGSFTGIIDPCKILGSGRRFLICPREYLSGVLRKQCICKR